MADTTQEPKPYRIWRGDDALLIQVGGATIELPIRAVSGLIDDLRAAIPSLERQRHSIKWTDERQAELRRLYVGEQLGATAIAAKFGCRPQTISSALSRFGIPARDQERSELSRRAAMKRWAA